MTERNVVVLPWIRTKIDELRSAEVFVGLLSPDPAEQYSGGYLYLQGPGSLDAAREFVSQKTTLEVVCGKGFQW